MTEIVKKKLSWGQWGAIALVLFGLAAALIIESRAPVPLPAAADDSLTSDRLARLSEVRFTDLDGHAVSLAAFRGKVVLLNYWATWCAPCRVEFPALDRLQARFAGDGLVVVPVSIDHGGRAPVVDYFARLGLKSLVPYLDPAESGPDLMGLRGVPTTLLIDRQGRPLEIREGNVDWDAPAVQASVKHALAGPGTG